VWALPEHAIVPICPVHGKCIACSGVLGDTQDRTLVIAAGALLWSLCTVGVSMSTTLWAAGVFTAFNGLGLALVIPCALAAALLPASERCLRAATVDAEERTLTLFAAMSSAQRLEPHSAPRSVLRTPGCAPLARRCAQSLRAHLSRFEQHRKCTVATDGLSARHVL
jgi:hypothetical protein